MFVKELWRYPVKSMAGERLQQIDVDELGLAGDRQILVRSAAGRVLTSRTHPNLLGLKGSIGKDGVPQISGHLWSSPEALALVRGAVGPGSELFFYKGPERFDILPLLVATDGAIAAFGHDYRRLRPNIIVGGVEGLAERAWPGKSLRIGDAIISIRDLRGRCVMTTFDPDTLEQDHSVLKEIVRKFDGELALNASALQAGTIHEGDEVALLDATPGS